MIGANNAEEFNNALKKIDSYAQKGNINHAIEIYEKWSQKGNTNKSNFMFLNLLNSVLKSNRMSEAKTIVTEFNNTKVLSRTANNSDVTILCSIFETMSNHPDLTEFKWFVDNLVFTCKYVDRRVLETIIRIVLRNYKDLDASLDLFYCIADQFRVTPLQRDLLCELINRSDTDGLEKILTISTKMHGQENSFYEMAFAFTICGRIDQAKKIITSLDTEAHYSHRIDMFIDNLKLRRQTTSLFNLLGATESLVSKQCRSRIYLALLELYAYEQDSNEKIQDLCSAMDKERIVPDDKDIQKYMKLMKRRNIDMPKSWEQNQRGGDCEKILEIHLNKNNIHEANKILYNYLESQTPLPRPSIRYCLLKNAENGNTDIFENLRSKLDLQTKMQLNFSTHECEAYTKAGKIDTYLEILRKVINDNDGDLKQLAFEMPEHHIKMIESNPDIYENCE